MLRPADHRHVLRTPGPRDRRRRALAAARAADWCGARDVVLHLGYSHGEEPAVVFDRMVEGLALVLREMEDEGIAVTLRPENMGRRAQFGDLSEILGLCRELPALAPCIDIAHLHARTGAWNSRPEFHALWDAVGDALGQEALARAHVHISGIEFASGGERRHRPLGESDLDNLRELLSRFLRGRFKLSFDPSLDRRSFKGLRIEHETGYGTYAISAFASAGDSALLLVGREWDRGKTFAEQRRSLIRIDGAPASGPADAVVTVVEYSDMQCPFCKKRAADLDALVARMGKELKIRRVSKAFPIAEHTWAFRASSAGACFFSKRKELFASWKSSVFARQESLSVGELDTFALDFATIAVTELSSISERRTDRILDPVRSAGLAPFTRMEIKINQPLYTFGKLKAHIEAAAKGLQAKEASLTRFKEALSTTERPLLRCS